MVAKMSSLRFLVVLALASLLGVPPAAAAVGGPAVETAEIGVDNTVCVRVLPLMPTYSLNSGCGSFDAVIDGGVGELVTSRTEFFLDPELEPIPRSCFVTRQSAVITGVEFEACANPQGYDYYWGWVCFTFSPRQPPQEKCTYIIR